MKHQKGLVQMEHSTGKAAGQEQFLLSLFRKLTPDRQKIVLEIAEILSEMPQNNATGTESE